MPLKTSRILRTISSVLALVVASVGLSAAPGRTQEPQLHTGGISGYAKAVCIFGAPVQSLSSNATFTRSVSGGTLAIGQLADRDTGVAQAASVGLNLDSVCNQPSRLRIRSLNGGMSAVEGGGSGPFGAAINYVVTVSWGSQQVVLTTDGTAGSFIETPLIGANASGLNVDIAIPAGTDPLVAGDYLDTLVIEFLTGT